MARDDGSLNAPRTISVTLQCSEFVLLVVKIQHRVEIGPESLALVALTLKDRFLHNVFLLTIQIRLSAKTT